MKENQIKAQTRRQALIVWTYIEKKKLSTAEKTASRETETRNPKQRRTKKSFSKNATKIAPNPRSSGEEEEEGTATTTTTTTSEHSRPLSFFLSFFLPCWRWVPARCQYCIHRLILSTNYLGFIYWHYLWSALAYEVAAAWPGFLHRTNATATGKTPKGTGFNRLIYYTQGRVLSVPYSKFSAFLLLPINSPESYMEY